MEGCIKHYFVESAKAQAAHVKKVDDTNQEIKNIKAQLKKDVECELSNPENWTVYGCMVAFNYSDEDDKLVPYFDAVQEICNGIQHYQYWLQVTSYYTAGSETGVKLRELFTERFGVIPAEQKPTVVMVVPRER